MKEVVVPLVVAVLGGGLVTAAGQMITALRKSRQDEERLPAEVEGLFLGNAEKALSILQGALDRSEEQIGRLETALDRERQASLAKDRRINELEDQLGVMRRQVNLLQTQCDQLGVKIAELRDDDEPGAGHV